MALKRPAASASGRRFALDEALLEVAHDAAGQGALSILPYFDEIAKQAGIET